VLKRRDRESSAATGIVPGYTGLEEIGGGAYASVYRATEVDTGRQVALKILKVDPAQSYLLETFHQEIQALGKVSDHPNIVTLYRPLSAPDGRPVLVLELCQESLAHQLRVSGPLDARTVVRVGIKVAGALETAHRSGFLHRDMKPQNILITQFGEPALADFGVAALQASAQASAGVLGFTTLHAAPEMLEGHALSPATDVYGLASTMYQLLTGLAPFAAFDNEAPASVILRIIRDPVRPLRSEGVPVALSDLLEAALAKEPEGRPRSAAGFAESLQAVEAAEGWGVTDYVAWGAPITDDRGNEGSAGEPPYASAPPVQPAAPRSRSGSQPRSQPGEGPPAPKPEPINPAAPAASVEPKIFPPPPPVTGPPGPPGPAGVGPSIAAPGAAARNVIMPDEAMRGQPAVPLEAPAAPLQPMPDPAARPSATDRPVFVDPGPEQMATSASAETIYEETLQGGHSLSPRRPEVPTVASSPPWWRDLPVSVLIGLGAALVVIVVAVLLILGTL
jgi:serine/threonine protein kinase